MWHKVTGNSYIVLNDLFNNKYESMDNIKTIKSNNPSTLSFVGDVSLADNWFIAPKYDSRGGIEGVLSKDILKIMTDSDLMVVNSEFTVSNRGSALRGKQYTFRAKPDRLPIYNEMGVDLVTLANNHVYDYGEDAFLDMLKAFDKYKIPRVGAGKNIEEAKKPFYFIINGYKIAIVNATRAEKYIMTPGATKTSGGVFRCYDPTDMINLIKSLKDETDYIIPVIHFGREDSHELETEQVSSAKKYIDAGASMVVGHHAHTLQGVEIYKDKPIIYNLGNFLFNDLKVDTAIYKVILNDDGSMEYYMIPALQENCSTKLLTGNEKQRVINDINSWSINAYLDKNGKIIRK
jgi:poly-gamma-glutamate synthesis protein (capsule biosynthesis protein)